MNDAISFPLRHVSIRVPWHDSGWQGVVCEAPNLNGACVKLKRIAANAIWHFFKQDENQSLGLSEIAVIASEIDVSVEEVLSVLSLLTGPSKEFTRCVFYRRRANGIRENISARDVIAETRRWWVEHKISEEQWQNWASKILVGWEPANDR